MANITYLRIYIWLKIIYTQIDYMAANYDRINLTVAKGRKAAIQAHAAARGESVNAFIGRAIDEAMERDKGECSNA